jgi:hypothetical protein
MTPNFNLLCEAFSLAVLLCCFQQRLRLLYLEVPSQRLDNRASRLKASKSDTAGLEERCTVSIREANLCEIEIVSSQY